jgi:hypothetical protein
MRPRGLRVGENSRQAWVRRTRESVLRQLSREYVACSAGYLEDNLDITGYSHGFGFYDRRSAREISAALRWLVAQGYAEEVHERVPDDPPGKLYVVTTRGVLRARETVEGETDKVRGQRVP